MFHRIFTGLIVALVASSVLASAAAQPEAVEVSLVSVTPGTPSGDGDWCVGAAQITVTARVVDLASQREVEEGVLFLMFCTIPNLGAFPKEDCDVPGPARYGDGVGDDLAMQPLSITFTPNLPVMGVRLQYRPAPGSHFRRATSVAFNIDTTCSP